MNRIKSLFLLCIVGLISFAFGQHYKPNSKEFKWRLAEAFPDWISECVEPTNDEKAFYNLVLTTLEQTSKTKKYNWPAGSLEIGSQQFLSKGVYRSIGKEKIAVCPDTGTYEKIGDILTNYDGLSARLVEYQLTLAAKVKNPSDYIVNAVANSAFNDQPQQSEFFEDIDIRPYARTVLASFGTKSSYYAEKAYQQISTNNSLGTGAAQVAVGAGYGDALALTEKLMFQLLNDIPKNTAIPRETRNRLYELAYAISFAPDDKGKKHVGALKDLMARKVQSWAPPFGLIEANPKRMCRVLENIEGKASLNDYAYCIDEKVPFEQ